MKGLALHGVSFVRGWKSRGSMRKIVCGSATSQVPSLALTPQRGVLN